MFVFGVYLLVWRSECEEELRKMVSNGCVGKVISLTSILKVIMLQRASLWDV